VQREAKKLKDQGYHVKAAGIRGYEQPEEVAGHIPDIIATRPGQRLIKEVELEDTRVSHKQQIEAFRRHAAQKADTEFELVVTKPRKKR